MFDRMGRQLETGTLGELQAVPVDLRDHGEEYVLHADLPGYDVDDVDLSYADGNVRVEASRDTDPGGDAADDAETVEFVNRERTEAVSRNVHVPEAVVEAEITAAYEDGVLRVSLPKRSETVEGHSIDID